MIERKTMRDAGAAIVSDQRKLVVSERLHHLNLVLGHHALILPQIICGRVQKW